MRSRDAPREGAESIVFRALSDPTRRGILRALGGGELRASDVAARFDQSRPSISRHLGILVKAGLVQVRASGRERFYAILPGPLRDAAQLVQDLDAAWAERLQRLGEHLGSQRRPRSP